MVWLNGTRYISLHLANGTELSAHGYARKAVTLSGWTISSTGVAVGATDLEIFTATDASAQDPGQVALYSAATGGSQIYEAEDLTTDVAAPANGQAVRLTLTLNP